MRLFSIGPDFANDIWNVRKANKTISFDEKKIDIIGPEDEDLLSDLELDDLVDRLRDVEARFAHKSIKSIGGLIDATLPEIIHSELFCRANVHQLSQIGFWRWLSNIASDGYFWNFINWRFGNSEKLLNWGITNPGSIIEVYFYRAWLRGHKMIEPNAKDPYRYARIGASDMWRSHILRQDFGRDKEFVKAFLDTVYDDKGKAVVGTTELREKLIPAIRAWTSGGSFSHLTYNESLELMQAFKEQGI